MSTQQVAAASRTPTESTAEARDPRSLDETAAEHAGDARQLVLEDLLVEDVSIDGMCGVY